MRIYAIDDEPKMLRMLHDAIAEAEPSAEILDFSRAPEVMEALSDPGKKPDVVFSDIDLPGISGLTLVVKIKAAAPQARLVFVTDQNDGTETEPDDADKLRQALVQALRPSDALTELSRGRFLILLAAAGKEQGQAVCQEAFRLYRDSGWLTARTYTLLTLKSA